MKILVQGEVVVTASERETTVVPKIDMTTNRKSVNSLKRIDQWLYDNALRECRSHDHLFLLVKNMNPKKLSDGDRTDLNHILFDKQLYELLTLP